MCVCIYRRVETELNAILWCIHVCVSVPGPSRGTRVYLRALTRAYTLRLGCLRTPRQDDDGVHRGLRTSTLCDSPLLLLLLLPLLLRLVLPGVSVKLVRAPHSPLLDIYLMKRK